MTLLSDEALLRRMAGGDEAALAELYRRRQSGVYRFALDMSGSETVAEEVAQDVFITLIRSAEEFDPARGPVRSWLFGIARNHVLKRFSRDRRYVGFAEDDDGREIEPAADDESVLDGMTRLEAVAQVRQAVSALPPKYREVVSMCDLEELSYDDAAAAIECAVGTVRSRLHRGRAMLKEKLRVKVAR